MVGAFLYVYLLFSLLNFGLVSAPALYKNPAVNSLLEKLFSSDPCDRPAVDTVLFSVWLTHRYNKPCLADASIKRLKPCGVKDARCLEATSSKLQAFAASQVHALFLFSLSLSIYFSLSLSGGASRGSAILKVEKAQLLHKKRAGEPQRWKSSTPQCRPLSTLWLWLWLSLSLSLSFFFSLSLSLCLSLSLSLPLSISLDEHVICMGRCEGVLDFMGREVTWRATCRMQAVKRAVAKLQGAKIGSFLQEDERPWIGDRKST